MPAKEIRLFELTCGGLALEKPSRPALRWHGGKWLLAPWIIEHFPEHRTYVEPFGGAASVLIRKPRSHAEIYNDLDDDAVNLFEVLRGGRAEELRAAVAATPFARTEFNAAYLPTSDPVERARRLIVRSFMGFGSDGHNSARPTGFRANSNRSGTAPARDWVNYPNALSAIIERLKGVVIENRQAVDVMAQHDSTTTLHYVDPPYIWETRNREKNYRHELSDADHANLLDVVSGLQGMVILSGYPHLMYDAAMPNWRRVERVAFADGARKRTEVIWINPAAIERLGYHDLFAAE